MPVGASNGYGIRFECGENDGQENNQVLSIAAELNSYPETENKNRESEPSVQEDSETIE